MALEAARGDTGFETCERCGQTYRRPQWGRSYACGACGGSLDSKTAGGSGRTLPKWLIALATLALFAGCIIALTAVRSGDAFKPPPLTANGGSVSAHRVLSVTLPLHLEARLREKIRYLESDLSLEPANERLLVRTIESYAALALALRESKRPEAEKHLATARQLAVRLERQSPLMGANFSFVKSDLDTLTWVDQNNGGEMLPQMMGVSLSGASLTRMPTGNSPPVGPTAGPPGQFSPGAYPSLNGPGTAPHGPPPMTPMMAAPGNGPLLSPNSAPLMGNSPFMGGMMMGGGPIDRKQQLRETLARIRALEEQRRANPDDRSVLDGLGSAYQQLADLKADKGKSKDRASLLKALAVFQDGVRRSRLRVRKAAFLRACGGVYEVMGDYEKQYRVTRQAAEQSPFSAAIWGELQDAALRSGHFAESREAALKLRDWSIPGVRSE